MDVYDAVYRMVADYKLNVRGKRVVLKPNLVEFDSATAINTHPLVVHAAYEAFRKLGAADVGIAEGPGHRRGTLDLADAAGYFSTIPASKISSPISIPTPSQSAIFRIPFPS